MKKVGSTPQGEQLYGDGKFKYWTREEDEALKTKCNVRSRYKPSAYEMVEELKKKKFKRDEKSVRHRIWKLKKLNWDLGKITYYAKKESTA